MEFNRQNIFNKVKESQKSTVVMDEGLRAYMLKVYNYMATGVLLTGIIALISFKMSVVTDASGAITGFTSFGNTLFFSGLKWIVMLAPLGIVFYMSFGINKMSSAKAQTVFWIFAALMGLSLSWILLVYTGVSVARVFFITSALVQSMKKAIYTMYINVLRLIILPFLTLWFVVNILEGGFQSLFWGLFIINWSFGFLVLTFSHFFMKKNKIFKNRKPSLYNILDE